MPIKAMQESSERGPYDELYTPFEALSYLLPYLPDNVIWESAPGKLDIVRMLEYHGYKVVWKQKDYFKWQPDQWDIQVTNPPFSIKARWMERAQALGKPFAILLPVASLGARNMQLHLNSIELLLLPRRIDFTGKKAPWFAVAWYTKGLNLPYPITIVDLISQS
jgi:hypothetical protein